MPAAAEDLDIRAYASRGNASRNLTNLKAKKPAPLAQMPNVTISHRHVSTIDKERSKGRWKLMHGALVKSGLISENKARTTR